MSQKLIQLSQVGVTLDDLSDVNASPSDGDVLTVDNDTSSWIAAEPTGGGSGSMDDFSLDADSGDPETVGHGETIIIAAGSAGSCGGERGLTQISSTLLLSLRLGWFQWILKIGDISN